MNSIWSDSDGNSKTTVYTYIYDFSKWLIGLLTRVEQTSSTPTQSANRKYEYTYDSQYGALETKKRVYDNGNFLLTTYTRDVYGNPQTIRTETESGEVRSYDYLYDSENTYVDTITNHINQSVRYAFNEKNGRISVFRDQHGVDRKRAYDTFEDCDE